MTFSPEEKPYDPDLITKNISYGFIKLNKINKIEERQQIEEAEIEILMTMLEKGLVSQFQASAYN